MEHGGDLTEAAREARGTHAGVGVRPVYTGRPVQARVRLTVVNVLTAVLAGEARGTLAAWGEMITWLKAKSTCQ